MKYLDEYRTARSPKASPAASPLGDEAMGADGSVRGQTHSIVRYGIDRMIPESVELVHGPGCPVCVTSLEMIDRAHSIAAQKDVIFTSFGDMLRVRARAAICSRCAAAARTCAWSTRRSTPSGSRARTPASAWSSSPSARDDRASQRDGGLHGAAPGSEELLGARLARAGPPAMAAILQSAGNRVQGFLGPGHVCAVMGYREYEALADRYRVPIVITGFEPLDLLEASSWPSSSSRRGGWRSRTSTPGP